MAAPTRKYRELLIHLQMKAGRDKNYYVAAYDSEDQERCVGGGFFYPRREMLLQYFWKGEAVVKRGFESYCLSRKEQAHLCGLVWTIPNPLGAIDLLARAADPEHATIFAEAQAAAARQR